MTHPFSLTLLVAAVTAAGAGLACADSLKAKPVLELAPVQITDWKAVYGRIEARDRVPARARIGGTLVELRVGEGDMVAEGDVLARVVDEKLAFQLSALDAQRAALLAQLANARAEVKRGEDLLKQGVTTVQRQDALRTQADVLAGQVASLEAQMDVTRQSQTEGQVLAPAAGRVLDVPVARGAVVMPGEAIATVAVGGSFLRLAVPERLATALHEGDAIRIGTGPTASGTGEINGRLAKVYPLIENGRVLADVEAPGLPQGFVDARVLVRLAVGSHAALVVPQSAILTQGGLDFVAVQTGAGVTMRAVVPGARVQVEGDAQDGEDGDAQAGEAQMSEEHAGEPLIEILSGLQAGDRVLTTAPAGGPHE